ALLRRAGPTTRVQASTSVGKLVIDPRTHEATVGGETLDLTPTEFRLLAALAARSSEVLERRALLRAGWPEERDPDPEWLKAHLARLRSKLDAAGGPTLANVRVLGAGRGDHRREDRAERQPERHRQDAGARSPGQQRQGQRGRGHVVDQDDRGEHDERARKSGSADAELPTCRGRRPKSGADEEGHEPKREGECGLTEIQRQS